MDEGYSGRLRKRKRPVGDGTEEALQSLLQLVEGCGKVVIFSGSGLSANSGMSMFTTKNGLYERARSKFKIQDGMKLFSYPFYKQRRKDLQAFFAQIYSEAQSSRAAPGHVAIAELHKMGRLQRHYTLNIDGLAAAVGMDTWHHEHNPEGSTVEMHGNISYVVCPSCHAVEPLTGVVMETMKACEAVLCKACNEDEMRFKVMLYDDEQGDCITPEDVFERLDDDLEVAGAVIWVGISFEQSASTEYFRKVRHMLSSHGRLHQVTQVILNPSEEPYFNVVSTMSNKEDVKVLDVRATSDDALPRLVQHLHQLGGTSPDSAAMKAAADAATAAEEARIRREKEQQQQQQQAAAQQVAVDQQHTPRGQGRRIRRSSSAAVSPADPGAGATTVPVCQGQPVGSASYAELASMDSAAAAALSLPAAVQKHFLQQQLQQQLSSPLRHQQDAAAAEAGQAPKHEPGSSSIQQPAPRQQQQQQPAPASAPHAPQAPRLAAAAAAGFASVLGSQPTRVAPAAQNGLQQHPPPAPPQQHLQQLVGQLQAVQALQAALAAAQQQQQRVAAVSAPAAAAPPPLQPLALPLLLAALAQTGNGIQQQQQPPPPPPPQPQPQQLLPGIGPLLAAALASQQPPRLPPVQPPPAAPAAAAVAAGGPLAAAAQLLASAPGAAGVLLSQPAMLAALAAANHNSSSSLSNGNAAALPASAELAAAAATAGGSATNSEACAEAEPAAARPQQPVVAPVCKQEGLTGSAESELPDAAEGANGAADMQHDAAQLNGNASSADTEPPAAANVNGVHTEAEAAAETAASPAEPVAMKQDGMCGNDD